MKMIKKLVASVLAAAVIASAAGCAAGQESSGNNKTEATSATAAAELNAKDLLDGVEAYNFQGSDTAENGDSIYNSFAVTLAQKTDKKGENTLVTPISAMYALAMAANGADGDTLSEIENTLGLETFFLNRYLYFAMEGSYPNDSAKFTIGNSAWINDSLGYKPEKQYLADVRTFFDANLYSADFDSASENIDLWLSQKSAGRITETRCAPDKNSFMTLVNSLGFEDGWKSAFDKNSTAKAQFANSDGTKKETEFMNGASDFVISSDNAEGFAKIYKGDCYAFAAIMPNEGVSVEDYLAGLTGDSLSELLKSVEKVEAAISVPKFEQSADLSLAAPLKEMGINQAFDSEKADFSKMGKADVNISLSDIVNDSFISVNEQGTNVALSGDTAGSAANSDKKITLDRPFVYVIYDLRTYIAKFVGIVKNV